ncbi:hypothetical protein C8F04DRAFT_1277151 [Mycena alexandri]|uniref:Bacteriophage T5 Orf172 DNA-binding domain-containing protein n=1 Tax=Mycena alexandri TaxID=1745969 RepID=A0AAD6S175_9AGAR|nr:hypothetical protein C8F04DRAFT_1277151 [Mycena alexandri]
MPSKRVNPRLKSFIRAFNSHDHTIISTLPDPYRSDGGGSNYLVRHRLLSNVDDFRLGTITQADLDAKTEYKWGETGRPVAKRQSEYRRCTAMYELKWIAAYTTPARKLSEGLVHAEFGVDGHQAPIVLCSCGKRHTEWFTLKSTHGDTAAALEYVFARWMALRGDPNWVKQDL